MNEHSQKQTTAFFNAIAPWRAAYKKARLQYLAKRIDDKLLLISARIYLDVLASDGVKERFVAGSIEAGQWDIPQNTLSVEQTLAALLSPEGLNIDGHGQLLLPYSDSDKISVSEPMLLHPEGLDAGNRLAVLIASGARRYAYVSQPETDWMLKAGEKPFDTLNELSLEYGVGAGSRDYTLLEVVALTAVQVAASSLVKGTKASIGVWTAKALDKSKVRLGYRVQDKGKVVLRGAVAGSALSWEDTGETTVGTVSIEIPKGAVVQCIASYEQHAHHQQWFFDPTIFQNPRTAVLASIDPEHQLLRSYLFPELPLGKRAADDFEAAVGWMLWALGFAPASFGTHPKTRDAFDIIAVSPRGHFLVIECTLGLLRAESKLSKLGARVTNLRETLQLSDMKHLQVLPVIITAMAREQVKVDLQAASDIGALVLTKENIENGFTELLRISDADELFSRTARLIDDAKTAKNNPFSV